MGLIQPTEMHKMGTAEASRRQFPHFMGLTPTLLNCTSRFRVLLQTTRICIWVLVLDCWLMNRKL